MNALAVETAADAALSLLWDTEVPRPMTRAFCDEVADPTVGQRRQAYKALGVLAECLSGDGPLSRVSEAVDALPGNSRRADRSKVLAHTLEVIGCLPAGTRTDAEGVAAAVKAMPAPERIIVSGDEHPRLLVVLPGGTRVFVEVHPAVREGGTSDRWLSARLAAEALIGAYIPAFGGVLVFSVRGPAAVHVTGQGRHRTGSCAICREVK